MWGSGVLVDGKHALTTGHVVRCKEGTLVSVIVGEMPSAIEEADWEHDVVVLRLSHPVTVPTLHVSAPVPDTLLCSENAWPLIVRKCGLLREVRERDVAGLLVDLDLALPVVHGNSGAGLFNEEGALVGLVTHGQIPGGPPGGLGTSLSRLRLP